MNRSGFSAAVCVGLTALLLSAREQPQQVVEVTVEKRQADVWQPVSSQTVFHANDDIRFRLKSQVTGFLYVLNHDSGGNQIWLYPRAEQQSVNRIEAQKSYLVPDDKGHFTVGGEPGFDVTYWMITPQQMSISEGEKKAAKPSTLLPRCRDELFKSHGVCEDAQAGPHAVADSSALPPLLPNTSSLTARELSFDSKQDKVRVMAPAPQSGSIVYALWIAHN